MKRLSRAGYVNQNVSPTVQYDQSQNFYHSTLADDIREFDFTAYSVRGVNERTSTSQVNVLLLYSIYCVLIIEMILKQNTIV